MVFITSFKNMSLKKPSCARMKLYIFNATPISAKIITNAYHYLMQEPLNVNREGEKSYNHSPQKGTSEQLHWYWT